MWLILAACAINTVAHLMVDAFGLLPYPLHQALLVGLTLTVCITGTIGLVAYAMVAEAILALAIQRDTFERLSNHDQLSGLRNRRSFFERFEQREEAGEFLLIDVDHFKRINDSFGHVMGDEVIRCIGRTLSQILCDPRIVLGRIGGEEFAAFIPNTVDQTTGTAAEAARLGIAGMTVMGLGQTVTISLGAACADPRRATVEIYTAADHALYTAKSEGRNRLVREPLPTTRQSPAQAGEPETAGSAITGLRTAFHTLAPDDAKPMVYFGRGHPFAV